MRTVLKLECHSIILYISWFLFVVLYVNFLLWFKIDNCCTGLRKFSTLILCLSPVSGGFNDTISMQHSAAAALKIKKNEFSLWPYHSNP